MAGKMPHLSEVKEERIEQLARCPWCHSDERNELFVEQGWPYVQCKACSLIYLTKRLKISEVGSLYDDSGYHAIPSQEYMEKQGAKRLALLGELARGSVVFEDGAGVSGFLAAALAHGHQVRGCDLGRDAVNKTKQVFGIELFHGTLEHANLASESLDAFACFNLLSHLYSPWSYAKEVARILKPGGVWLIRTGDRTGRMKRIGWGHWSAPEHVFHFTRRVLEQIIASAGLELEQVRPAFDSDYPYFMMEERTQGPKLKRKAAALACSLSIRAWTALGLPKDDVYLIARKKA